MMMTVVTALLASLLLVEVASISAVQGMTIWQPPHQGTKCLFGYKKKNLKEEGNEEANKMMMMMISYQWPDDDGSLYHEVFDPNKWKDESPKFTIRGLWPVLSNGSFPCNCTNEKYNPLSLFPSGKESDKLYLNLTSSWTIMRFTRNSNPEYGWARQWEKHGTCMPQADMNQRKYFENGLILGNRFDPTLALESIVGNPTNFSQVQDLLKKAFPNSSFSLRCQKHFSSDPSNFVATNHITEVIFCVDLNGNPDPGCLNLESVSSCNIGNPTLLWTPQMIVIDDPILIPRKATEIEVFWAVIGIILCALFVGFLIKQYARKKTPKVYLAQVFISWFLSFFGTLVLLPLDLSATSISPALLANSTKSSCDLFRNDIMNEYEIKTEEESFTLFPCNGRKSGSVIVDQSPNAAIMKVWYIVYWLTFIWSWVVCSVVMEYAVAGEFSIRLRLAAAVLKNLKLYFVMVVIVVLIGVLIALTRKIGKDEVLSILISAANVYGMLLIVVMLGYGIVEVPRFLWRSADPRRQLSYLEFKAESVQAAMEDASEELKEIAEDILFFQTQLPPDIQQPELAANTQLVVDKIPLALLQRLQSSSNNNNMSNASARLTPPIRGSINMKTLSKLHYELKKRLIHADRTTDSWHRLLESAADLEEVLENAQAAYQGIAPLASRHGFDNQGMNNINENSNQEEEQQEVNRSNQHHQNMDEGADGSNNNPTSSAVAALSMLRRTGVSVKSKCAICVSVFRFPPYLNRVYRIVLIRTGPIVFRILATIAGLLSLVLLWNECTILYNVKFSLYGYLLHQVAQSGETILMQTLSFFFLLYMSLCAYTALFKFKYLEALTLHSNGQSDVYCLLGNSAYLGRLQFALGFNFFSMLRHSETDATAFSFLVGDLADAGPILGTSFNRYVPFLMLIVSLCTLFNVLDRFLHLVKVDTQEYPRPGVPEHEQLIMAGRRLIMNAQSLRRRPERRAMRNILSTGNDNRIRPLINSSNNAEQVFSDELA